MIELPEAAVISGQINEYAGGKRITGVIAAHSPHKFAWYYGDPQGYKDLLDGKKVDAAKSCGGMIEIGVGGSVILLGDGAGVRFHVENDKRPQKHQLLLEFEDSTAISVSIQMYGGIWCFREGDFDNRYYALAKEKPSPLTDSFDAGYFDNIVSAPENGGLSAKALLATEQRIPGLGNGVLQDILFNAGIHPKRKVKTFSGKDKENLYNSVKATLGEMTVLGGRDTERDLFGCFGGYKTKLSRNTAGKPCPVCGRTIKKEAYLGGSIYYCEECQKLQT